MNILNYLFEILLLVNRQIDSDKLFKFNCNPVTQYQNVEKGIQSISFYQVILGNDQNTSPANQRTDGSKFERTS